MILIPDVVVVVFIITNSQGKYSLFNVLLPCRDYSYLNMLCVTFFPQSSTVDSADGTITHVPHTPDDQVLHSPSSARASHAFCLGGLWARSQSGEAEQDLWGATLGCTHTPDSLAVGP